MTVKVQVYDLWQFREVFRVTEWRDGAVFKTKTTGKYIRSADETRLDRTSFVATPVSTRLQRESGPVELPLLEGFA